MSMLNGIDVRVYVPLKHMGKMNYLLADARQSHTRYKAAGIWHPANGGHVRDDLVVVSMIVEDRDQVRKLVTQMASYLKRSGEETVFVQYIPTSFQLL